MNFPVVVKVGFAVAVAGLVIAVMALVPQIYRQQGILPVLVGGALYLPGAFAVFFGSRKMDRNRAFNLIRMIRIGFLAVVAILLAKIMAGG